MLSRLVTSVLRPAQYRSARSAGSSRVIAAQKVTASPDPTARPATRSSRVKLTSRPTSPARSGTGRDLFQVLPHHVEIVALLHHGAQGVGRVLGVQAGVADDAHGARPVDRLRHPPRLGQ